MAAGTLTSAQLTQFYIDRIIALDQNGPRRQLRHRASIRTRSRSRQPGRRCAAGQGARSAARHPHPPQGQHRHRRQDADHRRLARAGRRAGARATPPSRRDLRAGGAVILGKTNLSRVGELPLAPLDQRLVRRAAGRRNNPYGIDRNPCGSSSGSGAAVSAELRARSALGTETDGSIVCPADAERLVGIKPTVGLTSRAGVVPISHTQDTVGPHGRTVADAAAVLSVIQSRTFDGRDPATGGVPLGWRPARTRPRTSRPTTPLPQPERAPGRAPRHHPAGDRPVSPTPHRRRLRRGGRRDAGMPARPSSISTRPLQLRRSRDGELLVLCFDFRIDLRNYFATRTAFRWPARRWPTPSRSTTG